MINEISSLKEVLVHKPGHEILWGFPFGPLNNPHSRTTTILPALFEEYDAFIKQLSNLGVRTLFLEDLIKSAQPECGYKQVILEDCSPIPRIGHYFENMPLQWALYTRDPATVIDNQVIIHNFVNEPRIPESALFEKVFSQHKNLSRKFEICFDAKLKDVYSQGGDVLLVNEDLILVGVHNLTEQKFAFMLAKTLDRNIVMVHLPESNVDMHKDTALHDLNLLFLHLDSLITMVDSETFFTVPYLLEYHYVDLIKNLDVYHNYGMANSYFETLGKLGLVEIISKDGITKKLKMKLVDYLKECGYKIIYSVENKKSVVDTLIEALLDLRTQSCNLLAVAPKKVISYDLNLKSNTRLRENGIEVITVPGNELARCRGGPHCLVLPMERG